MTFNTPQASDRYDCGEPQFAGFNASKSPAGRLSALQMIGMGFVLLCSVCRHMGGRKCSRSCHCEDHF